MSDERMVRESVYLSAVQGRSDFRKALMDARAEIDELREAVRIRNEELVSRSVRFAKLAAAIMGHRDRDAADGPCWCAERWRDENDGERLGVHTSGCNAIRSALAEVAP